MAFFQILWRFIFYLLIHLLSHYITHLATSFQNIRNAPLVCYFVNHNTKTRSSKRRTYMPDTTSNTEPEIANSRRRSEKCLLHTMRPYVLILRLPSCCSTVSSPFSSLHSKHASKHWEYIKWKKGNAILICSPGPECTIVRASIVLSPSLSNSLKSKFWPSRICIASFHVSRVWPRFLPL